MVHREDHELWIEASVLFCSRRSVCRLCRANSSQTTLCLVWNQHIIFIQKEAHSHHVLVCATCRVKIEMVRKWVRKGKVGCELQDSRGLWDRERLRCGAGEEEERVHGWRRGKGLGFLFPKFPAPVCRAGTQSLPWKFLETGGGMKRSHWWLTDLSPRTPLSLPSYPLPRCKPALRLFTLSQAFLAFSGWGHHTWQRSMLLTAIFLDQKCHLPLCSPASAS